MNSIKNNFSIRDLENLTGVKAHTIRIWEKRYNLLKPNRSDTNIRYYDVNCLTKLLNIKYLNENGYKISKIASLDTTQLISNIKKLESNSRIENESINAFKIAMLTFDQNLLQNTYNALIKRKAFKDIFTTVFIPLLNEIGTLWQVGTISPSHEHYISIFIKQKILINIEALQFKNQNSKLTTTFVLYLPENEIHDIGLLYINYLLISKGYHTIYLGENTPITSLEDTLNFFNNITFISYFTVNPEVKQIPKYLEEFSNVLLRNKNINLCLLGRKTSTINSQKLPKSITVFDSIENLTKDL